MQFEHSWDVAVLFLLGRKLPLDGWGMDEVALSVELTRREGIRMRWKWANNVWLFLPQSHLEPAENSLFSLVCFRLDLPVG
jgi:hypothetical protein